jgi:tRNA dimethylallyltransferase
MRLEKTNNPLVVIVGPTAVGKTRISIELAQRLNAEIVSADSRLLYHGMDIGTAKPNLEERKNIPHYLIDVAWPDDVWSVASYQKAAMEIIKDIQDRGKLPFLVGGTGQYIQAVIQGWTLPPQMPDTKMRAVLEQWAHEIGPEALYKKLQIIDPDAATHIQYQNIRRTVRALEVIFLTGKRFSTQRQKTGGFFNHITIGLMRPRPELYDLIDQRIEFMVKNGLIAETERLLDKGYAPNLSTLSAIGYHEMIAYKKNEITLEEAVVQMKRLTRQFVRRQANWFNKNDPEIHWFNIENDTVDKIEHLIQSTFG